MDDEAVNSKSKIFWTPGPVIIGAGPSGLAVSACLKQRGIPSLILEKESCIGSLWKLKTYDALKLHLPKKICQLPYVKFPSEYPIYPTKRQFITYLEDYASHFSINPLLGQEVQWAKYEERRRCWRVKTNEHEYRCRWLIVATGENAEPVVPRIPGVSEFKGTLLHTSAYKNGASFRRRKALVVGCGNSGMEISLDLCKNGANVFIVIRDKFHILPKQVLGNSTFALSMWLLKWFPVEVVDWFLLLCSRLIIGDTTQSGIRRPEIGPLKLKDSIGKTPVLDDGAFAKIKSGEIKVVNGIRKFTSNGAEFDDGTMEDFDVVIFATGYQNNTTSWLQGAKFFNQKGGHREGSQPSNWKGENGVYSVGFNSQGLLGTSMDAHKVADDISKQWNSATEKVSLDA